MTAELVQLRAGARVDSYLGSGAARTLADDVLDGLTRPFKELPPKHFYDARGSQLFDRICGLPEYYPTRTERTILGDAARDIVAQTRPRDLIELGSGSAAKARILLGAMQGAGRARRYVPIDVSKAAVLDCAQEVAAAFPDLAVHGVVGDIERHLDGVPRGAPRLVAFLGGTLGNFTPGSRRRFLRHVAGELLGPEDHLLIGCDLVKDPAVIEPAYNDAQGVTAAFNRNVLSVVNRELCADFDLENFEHRAFYDGDREWVEMRLRACAACVVRIPSLDLDVAFAAGEELRTEISAKFTRERIAGDLAAAGLQLVGWHTDARDWFGVVIARRAAGDRD